MNGKLLPQATDLEAAILGACLVDSKAISETIEIFRSEPVFYKPEHQEIYNTILDMFNASQEVDILTLSSNLKAKKKLEEVGGDYYLVDLAQKVSSSAHVGYHSRIVQQNYVKRMAIKVGTEIADKSYQDDADIFDVIDETYSELNRITDWLFIKKPATLPDIVQELFKSATSREKGVFGALAKLNEKLNGYQKSDLIILAARPGMGKTALMLNEALASARNGEPVGIFSLEMSSRQLVGRLLSNHCSIYADKMNQNRLTDEDLRRIESKRAEFNKLPIYIHDEPAISTLALKIQAAKWKRENKIRMIFVDYLQLMSSGSKASGGNRESEISSISRNLKALAKELDIPVMALSQLSRAVETRGGDKRPMLSDLRESGAIEQDADIVMFVYRPEYYKIEEWEDGSSAENQAEIDIAKFRGGSTGYCRVKALLHYMQFQDLESPNPYPAEQPISNVNRNFEPEQDDDLPF